MSQTGPWSVKGIDQRARDAAREAAISEGITLGEYLNRLLMTTDGPQPEEIRHPRDREYARPAPDAAAAVLDRLSRRIEATEARSTLAITGIDHSVLGLVARLQNAELNTAAVAGHVEGLIDEMRATHDVLQSKVRRLELDESSAQNIEALKALETALGKLASHVYEESEYTQNETAAIKGRVESGFADLAERVEGMEARVDRTLSDAAARVERAVGQAELRAEGTARHLSERMSTLETNVHDRLAGVNDAGARISAVEADVSGALTSMESTLLRIQDRLNRAETTTDSALQSLETTFGHLDARIDAVAKTVDPALADRLRREFEARFEDLTRSVRQSVDAARLELADEIARAAAGQDGAVISDLKAEFEGLTRRLDHVESRPAPDISAEIRAEIERLGTTVSDQIDALALQVDNRIGDSEIRSAAAIEQVGEQVTVAAVRLQKRQDEALTALAQQIDETRKKTDARLSDALANVSDRFEQMQAQSAVSLSPVQKAIATLATRLEGLEAFAAPPNAAPLPPIDVPHAPAATARQPRRAQPAELFSEIPDEDRDAPFEAGIEGWQVAPAAAAPHPYQADFDAIRAAADRVTPPPLPPPAPAAPAHDYVADLPEEERFDPVSALDGGDDSRSEARESDIFDDDEFEPEPTAGTGVQRARAPATLDDDPSDYIARARRAAMTAQQAGAKPSKRPGKAAPHARAKASGGGRAPLYIAASAVVLTGAGVGGYLYLRGTQDSPVVAGAVDAYVDPGPAEPEAPPPMAAATEVTPEKAGPALAAGEQIDPALFDTPAPGATSAAGTATDANGSATTGQLMSITTATVTAAASKQETARPATIVPAPSAKPAVTPPAPAKDPAPSPTAAKPTGTFAPIPAVVTAESAAAGGNHIAQYQLAQSLIADGDFEGGAAMMRRAAQKGLAVAQYDLGKLYERGKGVPKDVTQARELILKAAEGGNAKAMYDIAIFLADGEGGAQSLPDAAGWFRKAAILGVTDAQYNLGVVYAQGMGVTADPVEALFWFEVAANNGDTAVAGDLAAVRSKVSLSDAVTAAERADSWKAAAPNALANGRFGAQAWNSGNPLQVKAVQTALIALGFDPGAPDGVLGNATRKSIRDYQFENGIQVTGTVTQPLVDSLNARATGERS